MKRQSFTLVEMLVVVAVIAVLMGLMFPAIGMVRQNVKLKQSQSEAKAIQTAVLSFKNEYHYLPDTTTSNDVVYYGSVAKSVGSTGTDKNCSDIQADGALQTDYLDLFNTLCYSNSDPAQEYEPPTGAKNLNPRKIKFLTTGKKFTGAPTERGYRDPWGRPYIIFLDTNYDGEITIPEGSGLPGNKVHGDVAVIGLGSFDYGTSDMISKALATPENIVTSWQ